MAGLVWTSGSTIKGTANRLYIAVNLNGSAVGSGVTINFISYRLKVDGIDRGFSDQGTWVINYAVGNIPKKQFVIEAQGFDSSTGDEYWSPPLTVDYTPPERIAWNAGAYLTLTELSTTQVRVTLHGTASLVNGGTGQVDYGSSENPPSWVFNIDQSMLDKPGNFVINAYAYDSSIGYYDVTRTPLVINHTVYSGDCVKIFIGGEWRLCEVWRYNENRQWQQCTPTVYNGSSFVKVDYN